MHIEHSLPQAMHYAFKVEPTDLFAPPKVFLSTGEAITLLEAKKFLLLKPFEFSSRGHRFYKMAVLTTFFYSILGAWMHVLRTSNANAYFDHSKDLETPYQFNNRYELPEYMKSPPFFHQEVILLITPPIRGCQAR